MIEPDPNEDAIHAQIMRDYFPGHDTPPAPAVAPAQTDLTEAEGAAAYCAAYFGIQAPTDKT